MLKKAIFLLTFLSIFALGLTAVGSQSEDEDASDIVNICDRSAIAQNSILKLKQVSADDCVQVNQTELARVSNLQLDVSNLQSDDSFSLKAGDFDDLVNLEELSLTNTGLNSLPAGIFDNLSGLQFLYMDNNNLESLPDGVFGNLTGLYQLYLNNNNLESLPDGVFENLTSLAILSTRGNLFTCIPPGAFGSRTDNFRSIKSYHYTRDVISVCVPDADVCDRTPVVRDVIIESLSAAACDDVELTDIVFLNLRSKDLSSLKEGDFDNLTGLKFLDISSNNLSLLPAGIFDDSYRLVRLNLSGNGLGSLPAGVFDELIGLLYLDLSGNSLDSLPAGVFDSLSILRRLYFTGSDDMDSLPAGVFDELSGLETLGFDGDGLVSLPAGVFDNLSRLSYLGFSVDNLSDLPADVFDNLSSLEYLSFRGDSLTSLPAGVFDNLTGLKGLFIVSSDLASLPAGVFDSLVNLIGLGIVSRSLASLPSDVSDGKPNLDGNKLYLYNNSPVSPEFDFFGRERVVPPVDDTRPEVSLIAPVAGTFKGTVNFSASSSDDFSGVELVEFGYAPVGGSVTWIDGTEVSGNNWEASVPTADLTDGSYDVSVRSTDFAGNVNELPASVRIVVDAAGEAGEVQADEDEDPDRERDVRSGDGNSSLRDEKSKVSSSQHSNGPSQTRSVYRVPAGSTAEFDFTLSDVPVYLIRFDVSNSVRNARVTVSNDSERPSAVSEDYDNPVYSYVTINKSNVDDSSVSNVTIGFSVDEDFVSDNNASEDDVVLVRYVDGEWVETDMRLISSAGSTYSYEASSEGFGHYAIVLKAAPSVEGASESSPVVAEPGVEKLPEPEDVVPEGQGISWVLYTMITVIAVIVLIGGVAVFVHMRPGRLSHKNVEDTDDAGDGVSNSLANESSSSEYKF